MEGTRVLDLAEEGDSTRVVQPGGQDDEQVVQQQRFELQVEVNGLVVQLHVGHLRRETHVRSYSRANNSALLSSFRPPHPAVMHLGDDVFELALLPGICWVVHHGDDGVVVLLVLVVKEHELPPQVGLLRGPENLKHKRSWCQRHLTAIADNRRLFLPLEC